MKINNGLFLPIEIVKREYIGKLLIAAEAASRGMPVFLGHKGEIVRLAQKAPEPGIWFDKSSIGTGQDYVYGLSQRGFYTVAQDEEAGTIYSDFTDFFKVRKSLKTVGELDRFFAWGQDDYHFLKDYLNHDDTTIGEEKITLTGSPRTALWGSCGRQFYSDEIEELRKEFGHYVMFVSNFASGNSYLTDEETQRHLSQYPGWNTGGKERHIQNVETDRRLIKLFLEASVEVARRYSRTVVIRPHPGENVERWKQWTKGLERVVVRADKSITPWVLASDFVVHNSCTTGIEAAAANVPCIALGEMRADLFGHNKTASNQASIPVIGLENLLHTISVLDEEWSKHESSRKRILDRKVYGAGTILPVTAIVDELYKMSGAPDLLGNSGLGKDSVFYGLYEMYRLSRFRRKTKGVVMDQSKRPTIRLTAIQRDIDLAKAVLTRSDNLEVKRVASNSFRISRGK